MVRQTHPVTNGVACKWGLLYRTSLRPVRVGDANMRCEGDFNRKHKGKSWMRLVNLRSGQEFHGFSVCLAGESCTHLFSSRSSESFLPSCQCGHKLKAMC